MFENKMNRDNFLIEIIRRIFLQYYKKYASQRIFYEFDNYLLMNNQLDAEIINKSINEKDEIEYVDIYCKSKPYKTGYRKVYNVSLENNIYLSYLVLKYFIEIGVFEFTDDDIDISVDIVNKFLNKSKYYNPEYCNSKIFIVRDIKDFYPSFSMQIIHSFFPRDKNGILGKIVQFYENLYRKAGVDFGLLQGPWHSRLLSEFLLIKIDDAIAEKKIAVFRKGDAFYFPKDIVTTQQMSDIDDVFNTFQMGYNQYLYTHKHSSIIKCFSTKVYAMLFPSEFFFNKLENNKTAMPRLLKHPPRLLKKEKIVDYLFDNSRWDNFESYFILDWMIFHKLDTSRYHAKLIDSYADSAWFLRAHIRYLLLINNEGKLLERIFQKFSHEEIELIQYNKLKDLLA